LLLAPELFGARVDNLDAGLEIQLGNGPLQEAHRSTCRVQQDEAKILVLDRKNETWKTTASSELKHPSAERLKRKSPHKPFRMSSLRRKRQVPDQ
jgi:hypothetical protein